MSFVGKDSKRLSVAVLVLFFEKAAQTIECLESISTDVPIYLLDNGSSAESSQLLLNYVKRHENISLLRVDHNLGVGPGRNKLIEASEEEWLFFLDNDITINTKNWKEQLSELVAEFRDVEAFVPKLYNHHELRWQVYSDFDVENSIMRRVAPAGKNLNNFPGGASIVSRKLFERLGLYDAEIFVGGEDYELCLRGVLENRPVRAQLIDNVSLIHKHLRPADNVSRDAAQVRYDIQRITQSMKCIEEKHGVKVLSGWEQYTTEKLEMMTRGEPFLKKAKRFLRFLLRGDS